MSMIQGVIQRLSIADQTPNRLVLRELPLLDWTIAFFLVMIGLFLSVNEFWSSAAFAVGIALYFIFIGRVRIIDFTLATGEMQIHYQTPLKHDTVNTIKLEMLHRAYLFRGDDGGTQIILVRRDGEEFGISVYSDDPSPWKEPLVVAINAVLYEAHKTNNAETTLQQEAGLD